MGQPTPDSLKRFERLYGENRLHVLAYCARRTDPADAADACSETFLVAWRRLADVPDTPHTLPYLYGVAARVLANQRRGESRRIRLGKKLQGLGVDPGIDPATVVALNDENRRVIGAISHLSPKDREIVMLYAWEELPRQTIAEMMNMSKAAIDQRIHRAYKRLARALEPTLSQIHSPQIAEEGGSG